MILISLLTFLSIITDRVTYSPLTYNILAVLVGSWLNLRIVGRGGEL